MLSVQTNMLALNAARQLGINTQKREKNAEKIASGYKINRAADDAAGLSISEKMRRQIRGLQKGKENITDGISWVQTGDGAIEEIAQMLHRMEELAVKGANGTLQAADRVAIDEEIKQLKREINDIAKWTTFNEKKIFDNDQIDIDIQGSLNDLQIYNASYNDATGEVVYGGFVFRGQRISWDTFSTDMVSFDPKTHEQIFKGGSYGFQDKDGYTFYVNCKPGATVPEITRTVKVEAYDGGITIDGAQIPWGQLYDEEGRTADQICHDGTWYADYEGLTIAFYFPDGTIRSRRDMADAISSLNTHDSKVKYHLEEFYTGPSEEQAMDVVKVNDLRLSNHLVKDLLHNGNHDQIQPDGTTINPHKVGYLNQVKDTENYLFSCIVKAAAKDPTDPNSRDGIWLEYEYKCKYLDANGDIVEDIIRVEAENSYRTWEEMGLKDWFNGWDVKGWNGRGQWAKEDWFEYTYTGDDGNDATVNDTYLSFSFSLSDITSKDSVVDGLDEMRIHGGGIRTSYGAEVEITLDNNILAAGSSSETVVKFQEEKAFQRDFDNPNAAIAKNGINYDGTTGKIMLQFTSPDTSTVIEYHGENNQTSKMRKDLDKYAKHIVEEKTALALAGKDPQASRPPRKSLRDLVGKDHITTAGYFDKIITVDQDMKLSDGTSGFPPGKIGKNYPAATIDFKGLGAGTISLNQLLGTGFNSTCKTCNNHYSIVFGNACASAYTAKGYGYQFETDEGNYIVTLDLNTFQANGVDTAEELADAIVDVVSECFDFHFTQYGSKDGVLYVYDDREDSQPAKSAEFGDWPFDSMEMDRFEFNVKTDDGRSVNTSYLYSYADFEDNIVVKMQQNNAGAYVQQSDGNGGVCYVLYDPMIHASVASADRYDITTVYQDMTGNQVAGLEEARDSYSAYAFDKMLNQSEVQLKALDYTKMTVGGNENRNVAIRSLFDTEFVKEVEDNGINIRCSAQDGDRTTFPVLVLTLLL